MVAWVVPCRHSDRSGFLRSIIYVYYPQDLSSCYGRHDHAAQNDHGTANNAGFQ